MRVGVRKEGQRREETNETRVSTFEPNKICGIMSNAREICNGRCPHVFTLHLPQKQRWKGENVCVYVCVYVCMCAWREERTMCLQPMDRGEGMTWRLEPGLKWENAPGNAPANCQPTLQRSLRIDVATVRNYSCPLLATFQRIGNSLWNSWNGDLLWWWKYIQNWLDITTLIFAT